MATPIFDLPTLKSLAFQICTNMQKFSSFYLFTFEIVSVLVESCDQTSHYQHAKNQAIS